jgi:hypothetical protein
VSPAQSSDPFTSAEYAYTVGLPAGWTSVAAGKKWDGKSGLSSDSPEVDQFVSPAAASAWGVAGRWDRDLTAYATFLIRWTERFHGDTCPSKPQTRSRITIGGQPGVLLEYDCGILINVAATVYGGVGYHFGFRDPAVHAASDPADHADFLHILQSAQFPE